MVLQSDIREKLDYCLETIELKTKEEEILDEFTPDEKKDSKYTIFFPPYYISKTTINYGNGKNMISTSAYQIRCSPKHAALYKCIFCRMNNESKYKIGFHESSILLEGPEKYRSILKSQNDYLFNMSTFPINNTSRKQMSFIRPKLQEHPSIKMIIPTNKTNTTGRWLIETTNKYAKKNKAHVENTLMELDGNLRKNLECDGFEVMPNIFFTSWGAKDSYELVNTNTIKYPDKVQDNPKPNACLRPSRMTRLKQTHTFETIKPNLPLVTITPNKSSNTTPTVSQDTAINPKELLAEIQSIKKDVLRQ